MAEDLQQVYHQAIEAHEQEDYGRAVELFGRILTCYPDADLVLYNQGLALYRLNRFAEAVKAFTRAAAVCEDDVDTWFNLGLALKQDNRLTEACRAYERALELQPDEDILFNLANCCRENGAATQAAAYYRQLLDMDPDHTSALNNLAYLCHLEGNYSLAEELYQRLLTLRPDHWGARHMLASLRGSAEATPANEYVRDLFDQYSSTFEQSLVEKLEYRVPELLIELLNQYDRVTTFKNCVDLGCGTGLAGTTFRSRCGKLAGVDLSEKMVAVAAAKELYDRLAADDVVRFLEQEREPLDLFVAADLLTYMADLDPLFKAVAGKSRPGSLFVFSTEHGDGSGWQVRPTGRFAHNPVYISEVANKNGGEVLCSAKADLRREGDDWVAGDLYIIGFDAA
jgi:predicted TPR repeat methyltransferase